MDRAKKHTTIKLARMVLRRIMENLPEQIQSNSVLEIETQRSIQEVQASMIIAQKFPRDMNVSHTNIIEACKRPSLADISLYSYPRAGQTITGPSIRLLEVISQYWGNIQAGTREISQGKSEDGFGYSEVETFAWDLQTNTKVIKNFRVSHIREKAGRISALKSPRDIYEQVANQASRRQRACLQSVIPRHIIDDAVQRCRLTLTGGDEPLSVKIEKMLVAYKDISVSQKLIEEKLGHSIKDMSIDEFIEYRTIYKTISSKEGKREDFFNIMKSADDFTAKNTDHNIKIHED